MAKIGSSENLGAIIAACDDAYAEACREGYADSSAVNAALAAVKSAHRTWVIANRSRRATKGLFRIMGTTLRAELARRRTLKACIQLHSALAEAAAENHLHNRCLLLFNPKSNTAKTFTAAA